MTCLRLDAAGLAAGIAYLSGVDDDLARAVETYGFPPLRESVPGLASLLRSIVAQQVSIHAARSIWQRLVTLVDPLTPEGLLAVGADALRGVGLSGQKIRYAQSLAAAVVDGSLDFAAISEMGDEEAIVELVKAKGVGRWTAEIYLMFALRRTDIFPAADLGLIVAAQALKGLDQRPTPRQLAELAEPWRPWRSAASHILWHYRHNMPDMGPALNADAAR
jgi:DNA-3-methyladenine glycosylase II